MFKNEEAVSPVIGTILMVAITVILAAVISVFVFGLGEMDGKRPSAAITVDNIADTIGNVDIKIQHKGGDVLKAGAWRLSIVQAGNAPAYQASSADFRVGDQIITTNVTDYTGAATYNVTNSAVNLTPDPGSVVRLASGTKYDVKIVVYPFKVMVLDTVIEAR